MQVKLSNAINTARAVMLCLLAGFLIEGTASAQEPERPPKPSEMDGMSEAQREMIELFAKVERNLRQIDRYLNDAAAGELPLDLPEDSGLADLLRHTQEASQSTVNDMDRILRIAEQQSQSSSQPGEGEPSPSPGSGESPLDKPRDMTPQQTEETPETPAEDRSPGHEKSDQEPSEGEQDPQEDTENNENQPPDTGEKSPPVGVGPGGDRWGELPPRVREIFRSQGGGDLPTQYRDWIDSYYRRLNKDS